MKRKISILLFSLVILLPACVPQTASPDNEVVANIPPETKTLKIAVLPIIDTLPMFVAQQEGLFEKYGVGVEFIPVASAPERDQLLAAGGADGTVNETLAVMLFNREEIQLQVVRYALRPTRGNGHFFILASAQSGITSIEGLRGVEIGVSEGTII